MLPIRYALVVTAVWLIATGTYFALRDDLRIGVQTEPQIPYVVLTCARRSTASRAKRFVACVKAGLGIAVVSQWMCRAELERRA